MMDNFKKLLSRRSFVSRNDKEKMKALVYKKEGSMKVASDIKIPKLERHEVLVRVHCASLNHVDYKKQNMPILVKDNEPVGVEFVGEIFKLGWSGGDLVHTFPFAIGDIVFGMCENGCIAEYVACDVSKITFRPDDMSDEEAASFPVAGQSAYQALKTNNIQEGSKVMIIGASGSVGAMLIKQARLFKAGTIIAVCSKQSAEYVSSIGADFVIDYETMELGDLPEAQGCDVIVDCFSNPLIRDSVMYEIQATELLAAGGKYVAMNTNVADFVRKLFANAVGFNIQRKSFDAVILRSGKSNLDTLSEWFQLKLLVSNKISVIPFDEDEILQAYEDLKSRHASKHYIVRIAHPRR